MKPGQSPYRALLDTLELSDSRLTLQLINDNNKVNTEIDVCHSIKDFLMWNHEICRPACCFCSIFLWLICNCPWWQVHLLLELYRLQGNITRVKINELKPLKPRFEVPDVLVGEPPTESWVSSSIAELSDMHYTQFVFNSMAYVCVLSILVSQCCLKMITVWFYLWERRARGWSLALIPSGWISWRGLKCCCRLTPAACSLSSTWGYGKTRESPIWPRFYSCISSEVWLNLCGLVLSLRTLDLSAWIKLHLFIVLSQAGWEEWGGEHDV